MSVLPRVVDLHTHSSFSDGTLTPAQIVHAASAKKVELLALCDHDTVEGCAAARATAEELKLDFVDGVELSTQEDDHLHILGYGIDPSDRKFRSVLEDLRQRRVERIRRMVAGLNKAGVALKEEDVAAEAASVRGRAHVADALVSKGHASNRPEAFRKYLVPGKAGYEPPVGIMACEAMAAIRACGGIPVLAHPGVVRDKWDFPQWVSAGLGGVEAYYPSHSVEVTRELLSIADRYGLLATAGSDYHGPHSGISKILGMKMPDDDYKKFRGRFFKS